MKAQGAPGVNQELKPEFGLGMTPIDEGLEERTKDRIEEDETHVGHRGRLTPPAVAGCPPVRRRQFLDRTGQLYAPNSIT